MRMRMRYSQSHVTRYCLCNPYLSGFFFFSFLLFLLFLPLASLFLHLSHAWMIRLENLEIYKYYGVGSSLDIQVDMLHLLSRVDFETMAAIRDHYRNHSSLQIAFSFRWLIFLKHDTKNYIQTTNQLYCFQMFEYSISNLNIYTPCCTRDNP